jgi:hypothetical protein
MGYQIKSVFFLLSLVVALFFMTAELASVSAWGPEPFGLDWA